MEYLNHTYDLITELDPNYLDAYQIGALFMFYEGRNPKAGLELLDKGIEKNPREWILPTDAGFYCIINLRNFALAASYFDKASRVADAPTLVKRMLAGSRFRLGDKRAAFQLWKQVYETAERPSVKQTAFQHMHDLKVILDLEELEKAVTFFHQKYQRYPLNPDQLVSAGILSSVPMDPEGNAYVYEPQSGKIDYTAQLKIYRRHP
jgi:tetratricopeptide (TPR) repeat protein